jgi:hypothetical protein
MRTAVPWIPKLRGELSRVWLAPPTMGSFVTRWGTDGISIRSDIVANLPVRKNLRDARGATYVHMRNVITTF